jgi:hypothetical protein
VRVQYAEGWHIFSRDSSTTAETAPQLHLTRSQQLNGGWCKKERGEFELRMQVHGR